MQYSFKQFLVESGYGITHIEDLPIETFIRLVKGLNDLKAVQKLDGANLLMGIDLKGKLYTSREQKGGERFYKLSDYPNHSSFDGFKTAHVVLDKVKDQIKEVIKPGVAINCEILFGAQPNTVIYGKDNLNYIAFLETIPGDDPSIKIDDTLPQKLYKQLQGETVSVVTKISDTTDGVSIIKAPKNTSWSFSKSDSIKPELLNTSLVTEKIKKLEAFLKATNKDVKIDGKSATNFEVLKLRSSEYKEEKEALNKLILSKYVMPIKDDMLDNVEKLQPSLRGLDPKSQGGYVGIEGAILTDPKTKEQFKVVDKEAFTSVNKFNYEVRDKLSGTILTSKDSADIESRGGIVGVSKIRSIRLFNIPDIDVPNRSKKTFIKFKGKTQKDTLNNIVSSLSNLSVESLKRKMVAIWENTIEELDEELDHFKSNVDDKKLKLKDGSIVKYTPEIKRRTLMTFAEARKTAQSILDDVNKSKTMGELINVYFGDILEDMQKEVGNE
jgi:hypothetical protein